MRILEGVGTLVQLGGLLARLCRMSVPFELHRETRELIICAFQALQTRPLPYISLVVLFGILDISLVIAIHVMYDDLRSHAVESLRLPFHPSASGIGFVHRTSRWAALNPVDPDS